PIAGFFIAVSSIYQQKLIFQQKNDQPLNQSFFEYILYSMKIKEQTRKLAAGCSKHCFEVVDRTDEVSNKYTAR
ncbi:hypothetical protein, partial [Streptococcus infantis]|uniref:hypothetical protein n=1 Tax=Streptococcus infantis TaxID=68892 RepID=UPI000A7CD578